MTKHITIAVSKGYLLNETLPYFAESGITFKNSDLDSRKLFAIDDSDRVKLLIVRPWDVPTYVAQGAADLGIAGNDVLIEKEDNVLKLLDLKFGGCRLVLAGLADLTETTLPHHLTVATKYPNATKRYFKDKGLSANILKLYGAIELAPLTGLSDIICDLTATGQTLKDHGLHIIDTVFTSTAILIANPIAMSIKHADILHLVTQLKGQLSQQR